MGAGGLGGRGGGGAGGRQLTTNRPFMKKTRLSSLVFSSRFTQFKVFDLNTWGKGKKMAGVVGGRCWGVGGGGGGVVQPTGSL